MSKFGGQVDLLLQCLPVLRKNPHFAIKGGTAINLFYQDIPRLSVDIDLHYCHVEPYDIAINSINAEIGTIKKEIIRVNPRIQISERWSGDHQVITKLFVKNEHATIKIEPNYVLRGTLLPIESLSVSPGVEKRFGRYIDAISILSREEVYAGKICAGLSRQHPRDLFDIQLLLNEGISDLTRQAFVVYLCCASKPIHELLNPNKLDISQSYEKEFLHMAEHPISLVDLERVRDELISWILTNLSQEEREFILSVKKCSPEYRLLSFKNLNNFPTLQWEINNLLKMDKNKNIIMLKKLEEVLW